MSTGQTVTFTWALYKDAMATPPERSINVLWNCGNKRCTNAVRPGTHDEWIDCAKCLGKSRKRKPTVKPQPVLVMGRRLPVPIEKRKSKRKPHAA